MLQSAGQEGLSKSTDRGAGPAIISAALEWLWGHLHDLRHPHVLDCGPVRPATVNVLLRRGAKLYVADLISPALKGDPAFWDRNRKCPVPRLEDFLAQVPRIPLASLSVVLCWHLLDLLPRNSLPALLDRLLSYLQPHGALFCLLREPYLAAGAEMAWWLESPTTLAREAEGSTPFPYPALTNREMERLVPNGSIKIFLTRSGRREVLATK